MLNKKKALVAAMLAALMLLVGTAPAANAATRERSIATDWTVETDSSGWLRTKVVYLNHGPFGNTILKICLKAKQYTVNYAHPVNLRVGDRWSASTYQFTMGRYGELRDGSWTCKRTTLNQRTWRVDDRYRVRADVHGGWPDWFWIDTARTSGVL